MNQNSTCKVVVIAGHSQVENAGADLAIQVRSGHLNARRFARVEAEERVAFQELFSAQVVVLSFHPKRMLGSGPDSGSIREVKVQHFVDRALQGGFDEGGFENSVHGSRPDPVAFLDSFDGLWACKGFNQGPCDKAAVGISGCSGRGGVPGRGGACGNGGASPGRCGVTRRERGWR